ncbi:MAG: hypothetical protein GQ533_00915 [Methanosarcinaceae archaeon]|nr:hypothetical protein [Methanosarcinaceae archaeon]
MSENEEETNKQLSLKVGNRTAEEKDITYKAVSAKLPSEFNAKNEKT